MSNWKQILGELAPTIGTVAGGPLGGAIGVGIKELLGLSNDASDDDMTTALMNPDNQIKIKQMEYDYKNKIIDADMQTSIAQGQVNQIEANSKNLFVSGWRPAVGWICASGLGYQILFRPIFGWIMLNLFKWDLPPTLDIQTLMTLLSGMLGFGAYRMNEKIKGVASK